MNYLFPDLVDIASIQQMMDSFNAVTGLNSALLDTENNILAKSVWQDICEKFHRINPITKSRCNQSDSYIQSHLQDGPYACYQCWNGLTEYAVPILVEDHHVATLFLGQLLHEAPDVEYFKEQAREFSFDQTAYLEALKEVPVISKERVKAAMSFFTQLAQKLASNGLARRNLLETAAMLSESEERFKSIANYTYDWEEWTGANGALRWVSPSVERISGYSVEECMAMQNYPFPIIYEKDRKRISKYRAEAARGSNGNDLEFRIRCKDGKIAWVSASWQTIYDSKGTPYGYRVSIRDIAKRKRGEETLRKGRDELEDHVQKRTAELEQANRALSSEITERERTEEALRQSLAKLTQAQERTSMFLNAAQTASSSLELDQVLKRVAEILAAATRMPYCGIYLLDPDQGIFVRQAGTGNYDPQQSAILFQTHIDPDQFALVREAIDKKETVICQDARSDPRFDWEILHKLDARSVLVVPIKASDQVLGLALVATIEKDYAPSQEDVALADGIASAVALAVENARLYDETRQRLAEITGLQRVTTGLLQKIGLQEVLDIVCMEAK